MYPRFSDASISEKILDTMFLLAIPFLAMLVDIFSWFATKESLFCGHRRRVDADLHRGSNICNIISNVVLSVKEGACVAINTVSFPLKVQQNNGG